MICAHALLDCQFRLRFPSLLIFLLLFSFCLFFPLMFYRLDLLLPFQSSIKIFKDEKEKNKIQNNLTRYRCPISAARGSETVDLLIYKNTKISKISSTKNNSAICVFLSFDCVVRKGRDPRDFWMSSKQLVYGSLVGIWVKYRNVAEPTLLFCVVESREIEDLIADPTRPIVCSRKKRKKRQKEIPILMFLDWCRPYICHRNARYCQYHHFI